MMHQIILSVLEDRNICWILIYISLILVAEHVAVVAADLVEVAAVVCVVLVALHVMVLLGLGWVALVMLEALE
jgi:hypothetical protein